MATDAQGPGVQPDSSGSTTIIRYPNRRLYDRGQGKYVTLGEIEDIVRQGRTVTIVDSKSGADLTRSVLTQIILERYPERMEMFPTSFLHLMIRANDMALGFLRDYLRQSLAYIGMLQQASALNPFLAPAQWLKSFLPEKSPPAAEENADILARRVAELERRLEELQSKGAQAKETDTPGRKPK
jgi:polyhydroxyalkanoate synthesis repressor PhaR